MYRKAKTHKKFTTMSGVEYTPVTTLKDENGGICHVTVDDECYIAFLYVEDSGFVPVTYIFPELHSTLCELDLLEQPAEAA